VNLSSVESAGELLNHIKAFFRRIYYLKSLTSNHLVSREAGEETGLAPIQLKKANSAVVKKSTSVTA